MTEPIVRKAREVLFGEQMRLERLLHKERLRPVHSAVYNRFTVPGCVPLTATADVVASAPEAAVNLEAAIADLGEFLALKRIPFAVVGALALHHYGRSRATN